MLAAPRVRRRVKLRIPVKGDATATLGERIYALGGVRGGWQAHPPDPGIRRSHPPLADRRQVAATGLRRCRAHPRPVRLPARRAHRRLPDQGDHALRSRAGHRGPRRSPARPCERRRPGCHPQPARLPDRGSCPGRSAPRPPDHPAAPWALIAADGWARLGSNQRPLPCEGSALPLSYAPGAADDRCEGAPQAKPRSHPFSAGLRRLPAWRASRPPSRDRPRPSDRAARDRASAACTSSAPRSAPGSRA